MVVQYLQVHPGPFSAYVYFSFHSSAILSHSPHGASFIFTSSLYLSSFYLIYHPLNPASVHLVFGVINNPWFLPVPGKDMRKGHHDLLL